MSIKTFGLVLLVSILLSPLVSNAATDIDKLRNRTRKFAVELGELQAGKHRSLCVCQEAGADQNLVGAIVLSNVGVNGFLFVHAECRPIAHNPLTGEAILWTYCDQWVPLAK